MHSTEDVMRRALFNAVNVAAGAALVLLALDPTRDLKPVIALLAVAVVLAWVLPRFVRPKE
jgi:hypothetical protein